MPDVFVAVGAPQLPLRDNWLVWEEGCVPDFVLEVTSRTTGREDQGRKRQLYQCLGVAEYLQFLDPVLKGARLVDGSYRPMAATFTASPRLASALGVELHVVDDGLRVFDPARHWHVPVLEEEIVRANRLEHGMVTVARERDAARREAEANKLRAEAAERRKAELEARLRASDR